MRGVITAQVITIEELTGFKKPIRYCRVAVSDAELTADPADADRRHLRRRQLQARRPGRVRHRRRHAARRLRDHRGEEVRPGLPGHDLRGRRARHRRGPQRHPRPAAGHPARRRLRRVRRAARRRARDHRHPGPGLRGVHPRRGPRARQRLPGAVHRPGAAPSSPARTPPGRWKRTPRPDRGGAGRAPWPAADRRPDRLRPLRAARGPRLRPASAATPLWMQVRLARCGMRCGLARGRRDQLPHDRARPAAARLRPGQAARADRGAARAPGRDAGHAGPRRPARCTPTTSSSPTTAGRSRWRARWAGWRPRSTTTRPTSSSRARTSATPGPRRWPAVTGCTPRRPTGSSAASTASCRRAPPRARPRCWPAWAARRIVPGLTHAQAPVTPVTISMAADYPDRVAGVVYGMDTVVARLQEVGCAVRSTPGQSHAADHRPVARRQPPERRPDHAPRRQHDQQHMVLLVTPAVLASRPDRPGRPGRGGHPARGLQQHPGPPAPRHRGPRPDRSGSRRCARSPARSPTPGSSRCTPSRSPRPARPTASMLAPTTRAGPRSRSPTRSARTSRSCAPPCCPACSASWCGTSAAASPTWRCSRPAWCSCRRPGAPGIAPILATDRGPTEAELATLDAALPEQPPRVAGVLAGNRELPGWWGPGRAATWADAIEAARSVAAVST